MLHSFLGVAGLLGLIALAFGEHAAKRTAQAIIYAALAILLIGGGLIGADIASGGRISDAIVAPTDRSHPLGWPYYRGE